MMSTEWEFIMANELRMDIKCEKMGTLRLLNNSDVLFTNTRPSSLGNNSSPVVVVSFPFPQRLMRKHLFS